MKPINEQEPIHWAMRSAELDQQIAAIREKRMSMSVAESAQVGVTLRMMRRNGTWREKLIADLALIGILSLNQDQEKPHGHDSQS